MGKGFKLRIAEYSPAASFLLTSLGRDRMQLQKRFSEFTEAYVTDFIAKRDTVDQLEDTLGLTEEQKNMTMALYAEADAVSAELNFVRYYFDRAKLNTKIVSAIKELLGNGDIEGAVFNLKGLIQYLNSNKDALLLKGMKADYPAELENKRMALNAKNTLQNSIMNDKNQLYENNKTAYDSLYECITTVASAGKIMYPDVVKKNEYTITKILSRMRRGGGIADDVLE